MSEYAQLAYWNERYARSVEIRCACVIREPDAFEWYQEYGAIKHILARYITKNTTALVVGCGTSCLSEELHRASIKSCISIDFSPVCIDIFGVMDARKLEFQNERFDLIIDKGTIDSILCSDDAEVSGAKAISEISRTLISGGVFIMISHASPEHREALLKVPSDHFIHYQYATVVKPRVDESAASGEQKDDEVHYVYVAIKGKKK